MNHPDESALVDLRSQIDRIDRDIVQLLAQRFECIERVVEIKRLKGLPARNARVEEVIARVRAHAVEARIPPEFAESVWRPMIEWVIGYEQQRLLPNSDVQS